MLTTGEASDSLLISAPLLGVTSIFRGLLLPDFILLCHCNLEVGDVDCAMMVGR